MSTVDADPNIVKIELGPLRETLEQLAARGLERIEESFCEQISSHFGLILSGLDAEQCMGIYAAMLLRSLPEGQVADG